MNPKSLTFQLMGIVALYGDMTIEDWSKIPPRGINQNTNGSFTYDNTNAENKVLTNKGIFFSNMRATLTINATISGDWSNGVTNTPCGLIFCANNQQNNVRLTFNPGSLIFNINADKVTKSDFGFFNLSNTSALDINANLSINPTPTSKLESGIFRLNNTASLVMVNSNLKINLDPFQTNQVLFHLKDTSKVEINHTGNKNAHSVNLSGKIELEGGSLTLDLANPSSFYEGNIQLKNSSNLSFNLHNSSSHIYSLTENNGNQTTTRKITLNHSFLGMSSNAPSTNLELSNNSTFQSWAFVPTPQDPPPMHPALQTERKDTIGDIALSNSTITLIYDFPSLNRVGTPHKPKTLSAGTLSGNGTIQLYADVLTKTTDTTTFKDATGTYLVQMSYNPFTFTQTLAESITQADKITITTITNQNSTATFDGGITDMGLLSYKTDLAKILENGNAKWVISNIYAIGESYLSKALATALNTPSRLFDSASQMLFTRLGDLRKYPKDYGLYFHYLIGLNLLEEDKNVLDTKEVYMDITGGYDWNYIYSNRVDFMGFGLHINLLDSLNDAYTSNTISYGGSFYYTSIFNNRFYYDIILKYAYSPSNFDFHTPTLQTSTSIDSHAMTLGMEIGKKFPLQNLKNFFYLEPQTRLTTGVIFPPKLKIKNTLGENVYGEAKFDFPLISKTALYSGYEWNEGFRGDFKMGLLLKYSLSNGSDILLQDPRSKLRKKFDGDFDLGISALGSIEVEDDLRFYFELNSDFLGKFTTPISFNAGIRWSFGDRYIPPPPPPPSPARFKIKKTRSQTIRDIPTIKKDDIYNMYHHNENYEEIHKSYKTPIPQQNIQNQPTQPQTGNKNRYIPRDRYIPKNDIQKEYNQGNQRNRRYIIR